MSKTRKLLFQTDVTIKPSEIKPTKRLRDWRIEYQPSEFKLRIEYVITSTIDDHLMKRCEIVAATSNMPELNGQNMRDEALRLIEENEGKCIVDEPIMQQIRTQVQPAPMPNNHMEVRFQYPVDQPDANGDMFTREAMEQAFGLIRNREAQQSQVSMSSQQATFTCTVCGRTSHNPNDLRNGFCGHCHDYSGRNRIIPNTPSV